jgi:AraC-like DNA-binding protein
MRSCEDVPGEVAVFSEAEVLPLGSGAVAVETLTISEFLCAHTHEFVEFALVRGGSATHHTEAGAVPIGAGDLIVVGQGTWHAYEPVEPLQLTNLYLSHDLVASELAWLRPFPRLGPLLGNTADNALAPAMTIRLDEADLPATAGAFDGLASLSSDNHFVRLARVFDLLGALTPVFHADSASIEVAVDRTDFTHATSGSDLTAKYRASVTHAVSVLHDRIDRSWTLDRLGAEVMLSPSQLSRVFTADTGTSPMAYLQRIRAERMAYLLRTTTVTIAAAGQAVGWEDASYATRRFRTHWNVTPHAYRARVR